MRDYEFTQPFDHHGVRSQIALCTINGVTKIRVLPSAMIRAMMPPATVHVHSYGYDIVYLQGQHVRGEWIDYEPLPSTPTNPL